MSMLFMPIAEKYRNRALYLCKLNKISVFMYVSKRIDIPTYNTGHKIDLNDSLNGTNPKI